MPSNGYKQYKEVFAALADQGWTVEQTTKGHFKAIPPDKNKTIVVISTNEDPHAYLNNIRDLKRGGFIWPPPSKNEQPKALTVASDPESWTYTPLPPNDVDARRPEPQLQDTETQEEKMDRLFRELKEAKAYAQLAEEHARECMDASIAAAAKAAQAERERIAASDALSKKKDEFDFVFATAAA